MKKMLVFVMLAMLAGCSGNKFKTAALQYCEEARSVSKFLDTYAGDDTYQRRKDKLQDIYTHIPEAKTDKEKEVEKKLGELRGTLNFRALMIGMQMEHLRVAGTEREESKAAMEEAKTQAKSLLDEIEKALK